MQKATLHFEDNPIITELVSEVKALRALIEGKLIQNTVSEPPVSRKVVMQRLGTTASTLLKLEKKGKITKLRFGRLAFYDFAQVVASMKRPNIKR
jgi:hypothetical protein